MADQPPQIVAADIFGAGSRAMPAALKAMRQVLNGEAPDDELRDTDTALAASFALEYSERLQFDHRRRGYVVCDQRSAVWRPDASGEARRELQGYLEQRAFDQVSQAVSRKDLVAVRAAVRKSLSARGIRDLLDLAAHQAPLACAGDSWDADPWALATADGTLVDLRTGGMRALRPADRVTRACAVPIDTAARCDRFRRFVTEICDGDSALEDLLRSALGYSVTGDVSEQCFFVAVGGGANGKSTLLELMAYLMGDLAGLLPFSTLTRDRNAGAVQAEIADLPGTRFVRASEVREGVHLDEGRIKALCGGDVVSAARKFGAPFSFRPQFKTWLGLNHRPRVTDRSHAFWRRAVVIPFARTFPGDKQLERQLRDEAPAIVAWLVEAALDWQRTGLPKPDAAEDARNAWRETEDVVAQFAAAALTVDPLGRLGAADAFKAFTTWAAAEGLSDRERPGRRGFGEWMTSHFEARKTNIGKIYGARLLVASDGCDGINQILPSTRTRGEGSPNCRHNPSLVTGEGGDRVRV